MAGVLSVERFSITLGAGVTSNSAVLTKDQIVANCVPFITKRVTTVASPVDGWDEQCVDVLFSGSTVVVQTSANTPRALVVEVTVVEFDATRVKVQTGTYSMTTAPGTAAITAVVLANSFVVHAWQTSASDSINDSAATRARFTSTTQLTFDRGATSGTTSGHWWVVESLSGVDFTVQTANITVAGVTSNTGTISAITMAKTFLVGSYTATTTADDNAPIPRVSLTSSTSILVERSNTTGTIVATVFAVTFDAGGGEKIQRGVLAQTSSIASDTVTLTAVDLNVAMAFTPATTSFKNANSPGTASSDNADAQYALDFPDSTTLRFQHSTNGGEANNNISWQVIEWEIKPFNLDQEGYRWYNDGTESGSTARQAQDTADTVARGLTIQLRVLLDATGDPSAETFQLEYKETGDSDDEYRKVPLT